MSDKPIPFVVNDRRKFNPSGEPREAIDPAQTNQPEATSDPTPEFGAKVVAMPAPASEPEPLLTSDAQGPNTQESELPSPPTAEQMEQSERAFRATAERLETAMRASNPGADHPPALTFESLIQSVYMQAVLQLGGGTQAGEQPQIDILGARQSIDMLGILAEKTSGNLSPQEDLLLSSAVFELRLAFLEMTQAIARSAQQRQPGGPTSMPGQHSGPNLVR